MTLGRMDRKACFAARRDPQPKLARRRLAQSDSNAARSEGLLETMAIMTTGDGRRELGRQGQHQLKTPRVRLGGQPEEAAGLFDATQQSARRDGGEVSRLAVEPTLGPGTGQGGRPRTECDEHGWLAAEGVAPVDPQKIAVPPIPGGGIEAVQPLEV